MVTSTLDHLTPTDPEWPLAWDNLAIQPLNQGITYPHTCSNEGECWQYLGTVGPHNQPKHQFRHKCHPRTNMREYLDVLASDNYHPPTDNHKRAH
jgi:hypothetical protein